MHVHICVSVFLCMREDKILITNWAEGFWAPSENWREKILEAKYKCKSRVNKVIRRWTTLLEIYTTRTQVSSSKFSWRHFQDAQTTEDLKRKHLIIKTQYTIIQSLPIISFKIKIIIHAAYLFLNFDFYYLFFFFF